MFLMFLSQFGLSLLVKFLFTFSPLCPENMDWGKYYPHYFTNKDSLADEPVLKRLKTSENRVEFADIGCGYGGLLGMAYAVLNQ